MNGRSFLQLLQTLAESVLMYGIVVSGLPPQASGIEPDPATGSVHLFGMGLRHPKASLLMEADAVPHAWPARVRCAAFWFRILYMSNPLYEGRIFRGAAVEAME